jgi:hypothetical protein
MSFLVGIGFLAVVGMVEKAGYSFALGVQELQVKRLSWFVKFERGIRSGATQRK